MTLATARRAELPTIRATSARLLSNVGAAIVAVALLTWAAPPAAGQPAENTDSPVALTLSLSDVGAEPTVWFYGDTSLASLSFSVPTGLRPDALRANLTLPFGMRSGNVTVTQGDRLISKVALPLTDFAPIVIPLGNATVADDSVDLTLKLTALAEDGYCLDQENPVGLVDGVITYTGTEVAPSTVADFLPPVVRTVTIGIPETPTRAESDAALQLTAALTARYRAQAPRVTLVPLPGDAVAFDGPTPPMERRIVVKEGPDKGLSLSGTDTTQLLISGPPEELTTQTRLLTDPAVGMALSTDVVADKLHFSSSFPGDSTTLAQLGQLSITNEGVAPRVSIPLDQTRFGHSTQSFRVHLMGSHTPAPVEVGARMTASVGNEVIDSWQAGPDGRFDHWVDVPDRLVQRYTNLVVGVDTSGNVGRCTDFRAITLTVDDSTVVESAPAQPPVPGGLASLPQALMPRVQIGVAPESFVDTQRAAQILVGLQRLSVVPLQTAVSSVQEAIDSGEPAILVSADGWSDPSITLPVSDQDQRLTIVGMNADDQETTLTLDPGFRFGSLQTVADGQRSLLIATSNGDPGALDELLRQLSDSPEGWRSLRGDAVIGVEGRAPQLVPARDSLAVYGPPAASGSTGTEADAGGVPVVWIAVGIGAMAVTGVAAYWLGARRRRLPATHPSVDDAAGPP